MPIKCISDHRTLNILETIGGSSYLASNAAAKNVNSWSYPLEALVAGIDQLSLSGWKPEECNAIKQEILAWQRIGLSEKEGNCHLNSFFTLDVFLDVLVYFDKLCKHCERYFSSFTSKLWNSYIDWRTIICLVS